MPAQPRRILHSRSQNRPDLPIRAWCHPRYRISEELYRHWGSFREITRASEVVSLSPSAVSMQVKKLEEQLKTVFFVRDSRRVTLTSEGTKLLSRARQILHLSNETIALFAPSDLHGTVRFGAPYDVAERLIPTILKKLAAGYPSITINVVVGTSESLLKRIRGGGLDIAIIDYSRSSDQPPGDLLAQEKTVWVGARHGLSHRRNPVPLALFGDDCIWRTAALGATAQGGQRLSYSLS
ncbi:LysR family transcriptional regulator [Rhizobium rhizogenes]|uniref:LysR family transcriptional regulator n=1 Tax=Rhizobium rhizogenes TaxID=359 RepID=UPI0015718D3F|nr:LysR family transcriptional regulator [Rhizobium rhizogenes]